MRMTFNGKKVPNTLPWRLLAIIFTLVLVPLGILLMIGIPQALLIMWVFHINFFLAFVIWWIFGLVTGIIKIGK